MWPHNRTLDKDLPSVQAKLCQEKPPLLLRSRVTDFRSTKVCLAQCRMELDSLLSAEGRSTDPADGTATSNKRFLQDVSYASTSDVCTELIFAPYLVARADTATHDCIPLPDWTLNMVLTGTNPTITYVPRSVALLSWSEEGFTYRVVYLEP